MQTYTHSASEVLTLHNRFTIVQRFKKYTKYLIAMQPRRCEMSVDRVMFQVPLSLSR